LSHAFSAQTHFKGVGSPPGAHPLPSALTEIRRVSVLQRHGDLSDVTSVMTFSPPPHSAPR
jgi:hypothetical protein